MRNYPGLDRLQGKSTRRRVHVYLNKISFGLYWLMIPGVDVGEKRGLYCSCFH